MTSFASHHRNHPSVGIIGGFGPDTSAAFCASLVRHALAIDPSRPPAFAIDFVSVPPDISGKAIGGSEDAAASLVGSINDSIARLRGMGVSTIAFPCNTMHLFADSFAIRSPLRFLHIVDTVMRELKRKGITRVGLLATGLTVSSRLYADRCDAADIRCIVPTAATQHRLSDDIARFVGTGTVPARASNTFAQAFREFGRSNAEAVILGCTDIGGMLERCEFAPPLHCIDSMDVLAKECAALCSE